MPTASAAHYIFYGAVQFAARLLPHTYILAAHKGDRVALKWRKAVFPNSYKIAMTIVRLNT